MAKVIWKIRMANCAAWTIMVLYFPLWLVAYVLQKAARLLLALAYVGLFDFKMGRDVFRSVFGPGIKHKSKK